VKNAAFEGFPNAKTVDGTEFGWPGRVYPAGRVAPIGRYTRVDRPGRVIELKTPRLLPPSFDGQVALYRPIESLSTSDRGHKKKLAS
jgi:hypothetical protein